MKLYMKQRVFSWRDKFHIYDEFENERYYAESELISVGKKLRLYDSNQNEMAFIHQKMLSFLPRFFVNINGNDVAEVVKKITFLNPKYEVNGIGWNVTGDFFAHEYVIESDAGVPIATISKRWLTWGDTYEIDIPNPNDEVMAISVILIIDAIIAQSQNN